MSKWPKVVAVVDDDPEILNAVENILSAYGYDIELYASAEAFLDVARGSEAACLVVDIQLGEGSGIELASQLVEIGFEFPIIFMSGNDDGLLHKNAMDAGCIGYLRKPFAAKQLIEALVKSEI